MSSAHSQTQAGRTLRIIGAGACSTTWTPEGGGPAFKFENDETNRSLYNDYQMHETVVQSFQSLPKCTRIQVPDCYNFITAANEEWWDRMDERLPTPRTPCSCILTERVLPFPKDTMRLLIHSHCFQGILPDSVLLDVKDKECFIRPYLGRCQPQEISLKPEQHIHSQVDIPLYVDQMKMLGVSDTHMKQYTRTMAEALATMHWIGGIDGNGVEYILAPPWGESIKADTIFNSLGDHCMWVLDFDLCGEMSMDGAGVQQAVRAFQQGEPFYPRPAIDNSLWLEFREQYLRTGEERLEWAPLNESKRNRRKALSRLFIDLVEKELED